MELRTHELKTTPVYFEGVWSGRKNFEIRFNDRDFQVGDNVNLLEWDDDKFTGRAVRVRIIYLSAFKQRKGFVVFGFERRT
jgi:ASC-1-like (ASCH) protein